MIDDQVEPESFVVQLTNKALGNRYAYHVFSGLEAYPDLYWSEGMGLQLIMIFPEKDIIVVRLGEIASFTKLASNRWHENMVSGLLEVLETEI